MGLCLAMFYHCKLSEPYLIWLEYSPMFSQASADPAGRQAVGLARDWYPKYSRVLGDLGIGAF